MSDFVDLVKQGSRGEGVTGAGSSMPILGEAGAPSPEGQQNLFSLLSWPPEFPPHFSVSQAIMAVRCPEQWRQRYIEGRKAPPIGYLIWGTADHQTMEDNFREKMETEFDLPVQAVRELFASKLDDLVEKADGEVDWEMPGKTAAQAQAKVKDAGAELVAAYRIQVAPRVWPVNVEEEIRLTHESWPVPVIGYIDIEEKDGLIERKTAKAKCSQPQFDWLLQARTYQLWKPKPVSWHLSTKTKLPAVYTPLEEPGLVLQPDDPMVSVAVSELAVIMKHLMALYAAFGRDGPWPGAKAMNRGPCGWCGYRYTTCEWWKTP